jgi:hypothetical protein
MPTIIELPSIVNPPESSVIVVTDDTSSSKITISDLRHTMVKVATQATAGVIKIGSGLAIDSSGVVSVPSATGYTLPVATNVSLGGVIAGSGLSINNQGVLSVSVPPAPVASAYTFGTVKIGEGLTIVDGVLSNPATQYVLPSATGSILGGVKIGKGLIIDNSVVSVEANPYVVESDQIINEDYTVPPGKTVYSIGPVSIGRSNTFVISADSTWTIYTPGATEKYTEESIASTVITEQDTLISSNYTIRNGVTASSIGPITIGNTVTVEISPLSTWIIF